MKPITGSGPIALGENGMPRGSWSTPRKSKWLASAMAKLEKRRRKYHSKGKIWMSDSWRARVLG